MIADESPISPLVAAHTVAINLTNNILTHIELTSDSSSTPTNGAAAIGIPLLLSFALFLLLEILSVKYGPYLKQILTTTSVSVQSRATTLDLSIPVSLLFLMFSIIL